MIASDSFVKYFCAFFPIFFRIYSNTLFLFSFYFLFHRRKKRT